MKEDRIDQLPDFLIHKILSSLPTETVISTSLLSKEWRSRWKLVPKLKFDSDDYDEPQTFSKTVVKSLHSNEAPVLESFNLRFAYDKVDPPQDVESWVRFAFTRHLRKLVLELLIEPYEYEYDYFLFTSSLCTCNTLETLKIRNLIRLHISSPASMKSLKRLHLSYVLYSNEETIHNLLSGCPILEELAVERSEDLTIGKLTIEKFTIDVPSLQRLTIHDETDGIFFWGYKSIFIGKYAKRVSKLIEY